jgi:endonuclease YncB( thermonuclease family)
MRRLGRMVAVATFALALPATALPAPTESARVIDGDTIDLLGQRIRLHGIDTPEAKQTCQRDGGAWLCGAAATIALRKLIGGAQVTCAQRDKDRYGRVVAVCHANGKDLNAAMVLSGMALAYRKYSDDYIGQEASAKAAGRGLWAGQFVAPWEWRRGKRLASETAANAEGCRFKGNIGSKGDRIYYTPGDRWYDRTVITVAKGERWFCSEEEARGAGWRRAGVPAFMTPLPSVHP